MGDILPIHSIIVALRNEKGSYNIKSLACNKIYIVALRNEKGSYNITKRVGRVVFHCSTAK